MTVIALRVFLLVALELSCSGAWLTEFWAAPKPPINIYMDPRPPFYHGVTSGDPLPDSIILWTRATPRTVAEVEFGVEVEWRIWDGRTSNESSPALVGNVTATVERDWTVKIDASPLPKPNQTYFFRFYNLRNLSETSRLGRTRTAPNEDAEGGLLSFAVTSCSQHTMYQNTFAHAAYNMSLGGLVPEEQRSWTDENLESSESLHGLIDLGDYVYDVNEGVVFQRTWTGLCAERDTNHPELARELEIDRATQLDPAFFPKPLKNYMNCSWELHSYEDFSFRHSMNCMDPDLRAARAAHPWINIVDSHDSDFTIDANNGGMRAFEHWTPVRWERFNDTDGVEKFDLFRRFRFGKLADVVALDARGRMFPDSHLGSRQREWLQKEVLSEGKATSGWRLILSSKSIASWRFDQWTTLVHSTFGTVLALVLCSLALCVSNRRRINRLRSETNDVSHYVGRSDVKTNISVHALGSPEQPFAPQGSLDVEATQPCIRRMQSCGTKFIHSTRSSCCSVRCMQFTKLLAVLIVIAWLVVLDVGSRSLKVTPETGIVSPFDRVDPLSRADLLKGLSDSGKFTNSSNVILSGDLHFFGAHNLRQSAVGHRIVTGNTSGWNIPDYHGLTEEEDRVGIEWLPTSTSSRNVDESLARIVPFQEFIDVVVGLANAVLYWSNPDMLSADSSQHGIGYLHITEDETAFEFYRNNAYFPFRTSKLAWTGSVKRYQNIWHRAEFVKGMEADAI